MEPLVALVGTTCLALIIGACGVRRLRRLPTALRGGLMVMFLLTGGAHFIGMRDELVAMVPPALPAPGLLVTVTGVAEIAAALALLRRESAAPAAGLLTFLLIAMFPANVYAADTAETWWDELIPRTLTQLVFLAATTTVLVDQVRAALSMRRQGIGPPSDAPRSPATPGRSIAAGPDGPPGTGRV
ncbi:hypothetical protein [Streptomyces sp. McG3]|uniref:DoxX family protein n=1 Tax=Streptomyces sp. McG3 TaxID=2725483 RepID=UPI001BEB8BFA|nr:hypothetical protein [Streptomyces sp. McG3]MBT2901231.1 hypothetical protein [Streptomyces sp. McG3]